MNLSREQYDILLKPLAAHRVSQRTQGGMKLSYLEAWDVKAHLIRIFGFGGWSADVLSADLMFEDKDEKGRWNVGYKVLMRLRIHGAEGDMFGDTTYTEAAVGSSTQPSRGDAHDMAVKTAESDALKRAAINLGTQFGLSLYNAGSRNDVIGHTLCPPYVDMSPEALTIEEPVAVLSVTREDLDPLLEEIRDATSEERLKDVYDRLTMLEALDIHLGGGDTPRSLVADAVMAMRQQVAGE